MKQIEKDKLCFYCLGCSKLEVEGFEGTRNCKYFAPGIENWEDKLRKELQKK